MHDMQIITHSFSFFCKTKNKYCVLYTNVLYETIVLLFHPLILYLIDEYRLFDNALPVLHRHRSKSQVSIHVFIYVCYSVLNFFKIILIYMYEANVFENERAREY